MRKVKGFFQRLRPFWPFYIVLLWLLWQKRYKVQGYISQFSGGLIAPVWLSPVTGTITSRFGNRLNPVTGEYTFHNGVDIAVPVGTVVKCPRNGIVIQVLSTAEGGLQMRVQHDNGYITGYAHLSNTLVAEGMDVLQGVEIAETGNSGLTTGPHLHLTVTSPDGEKRDPEEYFIL